MSSQINRNEIERLGVLSRYEILDSPSERSFDDLTALASSICAAPFAAVSFVDAHRQWFKSKIGFELSETPRSYALCAHTILQSELLIVPDALKDSRFSENPLVTGEPKMRFYAGMPLTTEGGWNLGTLCVFDTVPRDLNEKQKAGLEVLARQVVTLLELKKNKTDLLDTHRELSLAFSGLIRSHASILGHQAVLSRSEKMAALGEMASSIVHEINNPLMFLQYQAEELKELVEKNSMAKSEMIESCAQIEGTTLRIAKIIKAMSSFARQGESDPFQPVSLDAIITDVLQLCHKKIKNEEIQLHFAEVKDNVTLECRESQISQVLLNLLNNAADAIHTLGEKWIRIESVFTEKDIELVITDSGSGIPAKLRKQIFTPFYTTKEKNKGTGLGLSISKKIIESHKGSLKLDPSSPHTRFVIKLPRFQTKSIEK